MSDFFAELDAEIAKVTAKTSLIKRKDEIAKSMKDRRVGEEKKQTLRAELSSIALQLQEIIWDTKANVALMTHQSCACGAEHRFFQHLMRRQVTRSGPRCERWQKASEVLNDLPNEVVYDFRRVSHCSSCIESHGFDLAKGTIKLSDQGQPYRMALSEFLEEVERNV